MKKILIAVCFIAGFTAIADAQTTRTKVPAAYKMEKTKSPAVAAIPKNTLKKETAGSEVTLGKPARQTTAGPVKNERTTDSRAIKAKKKKG
jgi:hypothetical protein